MTRVVGEIERHKITSRDQWLALRSSDLTASDVGAAAGVDKHKTALQLYGEKTGLLMGAGDSNLMRRGRWLEPAVIEAMHDEHPDWRIVRPGIYLRDPQLCLGATPDALISVDGEAGRIVNCQCKVVSKPAYERDWADGPPLAYVLQALTEGLLLGAERSLLAALVLDTYSAELYLHDVPRHAGAEQRVAMIAQQFWKRVAAGNPPAADYKRDSETVAKLWPQSVAEPVLDLTGDNRLVELLVSRARIKELVSDGEEDLAAIDTEIKDKLGSHERAELPGWKITWKTHSRAEYTVPATTYRALRVTEIEEQAA